MNLRIRDGCFHCYAVDVGRKMETHSQILQGQLPLCQAFSSKTLAVPGTSLPSSLRSVSLNPERFQGQLPKFPKERADFLRRSPAKRKTWTYRSLPGECAQAKATQTM